MLVFTMAVPATNSPKNPIDATRAMDRNILALGETGDHHVSDTTLIRQCENRRHIRTASWIV
jgi:hypothetical protein